MDQNKWLRIMQEEQPFFQEPAEDEGTNNAAFFTQNQSWIMGEVEEFLQKVKAEKREEEQDELEDQR